MKRSTAKRTTMNRLRAGRSSAESLSVAVVALIGFALVSACGEAAPRR